ncbi:MAG: YhcH/YjgK/YiaL family protein [Ignavibacteria bacterium]|jgi:YhcH/YjgK/YiaL family protein
MVFDSIKNADKYFGLGENFEKALKFLQQNDFTNLEPQKIEIDGDKVFAMVQSYNSKPLEKGRWEAHKKYADVQFVASGIEKMGYTHIDNTSEDEPYNEEIDLIWLTGEGQFIEADANKFAVFFPHDAHMPQIEAGESVPVKKVVVKVLV